MSLMMNVEHPKRKGRPFIFGETAVARLIRRSGISDQEFAAMSGAEVRTVGAWRLGEKSPPPDRLNELCRLVRDKTGTSFSMDSLFSPDSKDLPEKDTVGVV